MAIGDFATCEKCGVQFVVKRNAKGRFCSLKCGRGSGPPPPNHTGKGKQWTIQSGYRYLMAKTHPRAVGRGYVREHTLIAEQALGHLLPEGVVVHHVNGVKTDNRNHNLVILQNRAEHNELHRRARVLAAGGNPWTDRLCNVCLQPKPIDAFHSYTRREAIAGVVQAKLSTCKQCSLAYKRAHSRRV